MSAEQPNKTLAQPAKSPGLRRRLLLLATMALLAGALALFAVHAAAARRILLCEYNLLQLQLALERYAVDKRDSTFPAAVNDLAASGYLLRLPENPFSGGPAIGTAPGAAPVPGDLVYAPQSYPGENAPSSYVLVVYGPRCRKAGPVEIDDFFGGQTLLLGPATDCDYALLVSGVDIREDWYDHLWTAHCRDRLLPGSVAFARWQLRRFDAYPKLTP